MDAHLAGEEIVRAAGLRRRLDWLAAMILPLLLLIAQDPAPAPPPEPADPAAVRRAEQAAARAAARERARVAERAKRVMMNYFQEDRHADLAREELQNRLRAFDRDEDARVGLEEFRRLAAWSPARALRASESPPPVEEAWLALLHGADADGDGTLGHDEALAFFDAQDLDADAALTRNERPDGPRVGDRAPDFALAPPGGEDLESLSSLLKQGKPVALMFGSWTSGSFRAHAGRLRELHARYGEQVEFRLVYVREAHPSDGPPEARLAEGPQVPQPKSLAERHATARACLTGLELAPIPALVDEMDDAVERDYAAWPERLYLLGTDGKVAWKCAKGPQGYDPDGLEAAIRAALGLPPPAPTMTE